MSKPCATFSFPSLIPTKLALIFVNSIAQSPQHCKYHEYHYTTAGKGKPKHSSSDYKDLSYNTYLPIVLA